MSMEQIVTVMCAYGIIVLIGGVIVRVLLDLKEETMWEIKGIAYANAFVYSNNKYVLTNDKFTCIVSLDKSSISNDFEHRSLGMFYGHFNKEIYDILEDRRMKRK